MFIQHDDREYNAYEHYQGSLPNHYKAERDHDHNILYKTSILEATIHAYIC